MKERIAFGPRRRFSVTILGDLGSYPKTDFSRDDVLLEVSPTLVYSVVPYESPNEFGFSEIAWTDVGNIRFWGAVALSLEEGSGFFNFYPLLSHVAYLDKVRPDVVRGIALRLAARVPPQTHRLH